MINYKVDKINSVQILDKDTLEPIADLNGVANVTIESDIDPSSLANEALSFNHSTSFKGELIDCALLNYDAANFGTPIYIEYYIPILVQSRWHKKSRINKKWLKRYGMKNDRVLVKCDVDSISPDDTYDSYDLAKSNGFNVELKNMQYKFRPDQLRKNLKIESL